MNTRGVETLSSRLKLKSLEATATALSASEWVAASMSESSTTTTSTVHHVEKNVGVDVDAVHASHSAHSSHAAHATHTSERRTTTSKHLGWIDKVVAIVICGTFPKIC
jgi:hypothetical protein